MDVRERIYSIMHRGNMCQAAVARSAGLTPKKFNDMLKERATITADDVPQICHALGVTPNELFAEESA